MPKDLRRLAKTACVALCFVAGCASGGKGQLADRSGTYYYPLGVDPAFVKLSCGYQTGTPTATFFCVVNDEDIVYRESMDDAGVVTRKWYRSRQEYKRRIDNPDGGFEAFNRKMCDEWYGDPEGVSLPGGTTGLKCVK